MRFDLVFSYWVFAWFLLYIVGFTSYNPKLWLIVALLANIVELFVLFFYSRHVKSILLFALVTFFIKLIPLYLVRNTIIHSRDIYASVVLFVMYMVWLYMNNTNVTRINKEILQSLVNGQYKTPALALLKHYV